MVYRHRLLLVVLFSLGVMLITNVYAQEDGGTREFAGLRFGVGISLTVDAGGTDRIDNAQVVDGVVRVDKQANSIARIMLESHYFFTPDTRFGGKVLGVKKGNWGVGPFVSIQPGTDQIIEAIGAGIMLGFRREGEDTSSWNFGVGVVVDPNVKTLGDGIVENAPLPGNETEVRFQEKSELGVLLVSSFSF